MIENIFNKKIINFLKSRIKYKENEKCLSGNGTFTVGNNGRLFYFFINNNMIVSQKKFYPNPQEITKIYPCMKNLYTYLIRQGSIEISNSSIYKSGNKKIPHEQESVIVSSVESNQPYYAREYEVQVDGIKIWENKEFTEQIDQIIMEKPNDIILELSKECKLSEEQTEFMDKEIKNFKNYDNNLIKYNNTIEIMKNNLTSSSSNNSIFIYKTSKFGIDRCIYKEKGIIQINRNEKDYLRTFVDIMNYKDNKGLQNRNIGDEKHQIVGLEIMKAIGGYNNIKYYDVKTKKELLNLLMQTYTIIKKNN